MYFLYFPVKLEARVSELKNQSSDLDASLQAIMDKVDASENTLYSYANENANLNGMEAKKVPCSNYEVA